MALSTTITNDHNTTMILTMNMPKAYFIPNFYYITAIQRCLLFALFHDHDKKMVNNRALNRTLISGTATDYLKTLTQTMALASFKTLTYFNTLTMTIITFKALRLTLILTTFETLILTLISGTASQCSVWPWWPPPPSESHSIG